MEDKFILNEKNEVVPVADVIEWGLWLEQNSSRRVVNIYYGNGYRISTIFLGLNQAFGTHHERPIVFETMVFGGNLDGNCVRSATWLEAEATHKAVVNGAIENELQGYNAEIPIEMNLSQMTARVINFNNERGTKFDPESMVEKYLRQKLRKSRGDQ